MARERPKQKVEEPKMDMTPIIDVVFNLLIFFMLTMDFKEEEGLLQAHLPKDTGLSKSQVLQKELEEIRIRIDKRSDDSPTQVYVGQKPVQDPEVDNSELVNRLMGLMGTSAESPVIIDPTVKAEFKYVIFVLNACKTAGVKEIKFAGKPTK